MDKRVVEIWYDSEAYLLDVTLERKAGYFRETHDEHVVEKADEQ